MTIEKVQILLIITIFRGGVQNRPKTRDVIYGRPHTRNLYFLFSKVKKDAIERQY